MKKLAGERGAGNAQDAFGNASRLRGEERPTKDADRTGGQQPGALDCEAAQGIAQLGTTAEPPSARRQRVRFFIRQFLIVLNLVRSLIL